MQKYIHFGTDYIAKDKFKPIKNIEMFPKPEGGLWSSPYTPENDFMSDWQAFCIIENFDVESLSTGVIFELKPDANIYTIDSLSDLLWIYQRFPIEMQFGFLKRQFIDYEKMAQEYDGILLTTDGQYSTRLSRPIDLYGWDVESLLIFNYDAICNQTPYVKE